MNANFSTRVNNATQRVVNARVALASAERELQTLLQQVPNAAPRRRRRRATAAAATPAPRKRGGRQPVGIARQNHHHVGQA